MTVDNLHLLLDLAATAGHELCLDCLIASTEQAGTLARPLRNSGHLDAVQVAACEVLVREASLGDTYQREKGTPPDVLARRLRVCARIVTALMPPVLVDLFERYTVVLDEHGHLPLIQHATFTLNLAVSRLGAYLDEHDRGEWVDPHAMAGAVADVHDAARALTCLYDVAPEPLGCGECGRDL